MTIIEMTETEADVAQRGFQGIKDYRADISQYDDNDVTRETPLPGIDGRELHLSKNDKINAWFADSLVQHLDEYFDPLDDVEKEEVIAACKRLKKKIYNEIDIVDRSCPKCGQYDASENAAKTVDQRHRCTNEECERGYYKPKYYDYSLDFNSNSGEEDDI